MKIKNIHKLQEELIAQNQREASCMPVGSVERMELEDHINGQLESAQKGKQDVERGKRQWSSILGQVGYGFAIAAATAAGVLIPKGIEQYKADKSFKANE